MTTQPLNRCARCSTSCDRWYCPTCEQAIRRPATQTTPKRPRRCRCAYCRNLTERNELHTFYGDRTVRAHAVYCGRLMCQPCTVHLLRRCLTCGRPGAICGAPYSPSIPSLCEDCASHAWKAWRTARERVATGSANALLNPAAELAKAAGVALPSRCDADAVRRLWKLAARRTHPDAGGSHDAFIAAKRHYEAALRAAGGNRA